MGVDVDHLNQNLVSNDTVDNSILETQARGPAPSPLPSKRFIVESLDKPKSLWARDLDDVLPFLVPLQDLLGYALEPPANAAMLVHLPHDKKILYHI